jgi:cation diffusion facilitator CzcD-associated flavoprotein CzcO
MTETPAAMATQPARREQFDVLIVGAGLSGIGAAYHLTKQCPALRFLVLDAQESFGGTWLTHTYPGVRSDSDLYTYGYRFKPWTGPLIATGPEILAYMGEVIEENDLSRHIRYRHRIVSACWSSDKKLWTLEVERTDTGETVTLAANFLWMCQGYYRHAKGYTPNLPGLRDFRGPIVHPQSWPRDMSVAGRNVVVIGSGATAATLIPAVAEQSAHVTLLQRSPTYYVTGRPGAELAVTLRQLGISDEWLHEIMRRKMLFDSRAFAERAKNEPKATKEDLLTVARAYLGDDYPVDRHFTPSYRPWRQRVALIPDGDLFKSIASGKVSVVTDEIERFTEAGVLLRSGDHLNADVIVTATGFNLSVLGDIDFVIDGAPLDFAHTVTYHGVMFTGVPNMAWVFGYLRESWTLRSDLVSDFVCRLLRHMKEKGVSQATPALRPEDRDMPLLPWIDPEDFNAGYLMRGLHLLPKRGDKIVWSHSHSYWTDKEVLPAIDLDEGTLAYA